MAADTYVPTAKVSCEVTLVKPTENYSQLETDYGLSEVNFDFYDNSNKEKWKQLNFFLFNFLAFFYRIVRNPLMSSPLKVTTVRS